MAQRHPALPARRGIGQSLVQLLNELLERPELAPCQFERLVGMGAQMGVETFAVVPQGHLDNVIRLSAVVELVQKRKSGIELLRGDVSHWASGMG